MHRPEVQCLLPFLLLLLPAVASPAGGRAPAAVTVDVPAATAGAPRLRVTAAVGSASAFRLSVEFIADDGDSATPIPPTPPLPPLPSPSLDAARAIARPTGIIHAADGTTGVETVFGALLVHPDGTFTLRGADSNRTVLAAKAVPTFDGNGITMPTSGSKTGPGATGRRPCLSNGEWGPPFTWDPVDNFFAFAVSPWLHDPDFLHCYPVSFDGLAPLTPPRTPTDSCTTLTHVVPYSANGTHELAFIHVGGGSAGDGADTCCDACNAHKGCTAWQSGTPPRGGRPGISDAPNCRLFSCVDQWIPPDMSGGDDSVYLSGGLESQCGSRPPADSGGGGGYIHQNGWFGRGARMDWYLAPTPRGGFDFTKALFDLTGAPAVPPLFGMGFMATYWGYTSMDQVEGYMREFRKRDLPIDSFIMDYDWFGPDPCGAAVNSSTPADPDGKQGAYNCGDYGYRDGWWNNQSFRPLPAPPKDTMSTTTNISCATAADVFDHFHAPPLSMHFGGIRKPRTYSNLNLARSNGWLLPPASDVGEGGDINFNFSIPKLRAWYAATHAHFIEDGMDFWWNDEGETAWFTYLLWNEAEAAMFKQRRPNVRHFTINRAHQPGMQRFPAVSWTGDGQSCTHEELLRGMMHGSPLTSCDLTSPDATTLVRQYQSAVFTPIMRVHMMKGTPRFPWFWPANASDPGYAAHQRAFQSALEMRYRFLPFLYSLAHGQHRHGKPIAHPASFAFPAECNAPRSLRCAMAQQTYMVGEVLLPSDLLGLAHTSVRPPPLENASRAVLPVLEGSLAWWFKWNTTTAVAGGQTVRENLGLAEMSVFVKAGAILPLQANASQVQHTAQAGGVLELQIYAGADGAFEMVEDDGISYDYATGALEEDNAMVRTTTWRWSNVDKTLTWSVSGGAALKSAHAYTRVAPVLFAKGREVERAAVVALTADGGRVVFSFPRT